MRLRYLSLALALVVSLFACRVQAQIIPTDFHAWFLGQVDGKPFGQQTLLDLAPLLPCVGSQLTPPNAVGERTKIWNPNTQQWTRVGFGEGQWVWLGQGVSAPPVLQPCGAAPPDLPPGTPVPTPVPSVDLTPLLTAIQAVYAQNERIFAADNQRSDAVERQIAAVDDRVKKHDEEPSWLRKYYPQLLSIVGGLVAGKFAWPQ